MKRPLFVIGITFAVMTWFAFLFQSEQLLLCSAACTVTGVLLLMLKKDRLRVFSLICLSAALAFAGNHLHVQRSLAPFARISGELLEVEGIVTAVSGSSAYTVLADFPGNPDLPQGKSVLVYGYGENRIVTGDSIRCLIRADVPERTLNERYYRVRGISVIGTAKGQILPAEGTSHTLQHRMAALRYRMQRNLNLNLSPESAAVAGAMVLGLKDDIPPEVNNSMLRSGTIHLVSISGLHLSILTACLMKLFRALHLPRPLQYLLALLCCFLFAGFVGFSASITRSLIMTAMVLVSQLISRRNDSISALGLSLLLICIFRPEWTLSSGLWLSAGSTLGIVLFQRPVAERMHHFLGRRGVNQGRLLRAVIGTLAVSSAAYVFTFPILLLTTGWITLLSPIANLLVAPFVTVALLGSFFCAVTGQYLLPVRIVARVTDFCIRMIVGISRAVADLRFAALSLDNAWTLILFTGVVIGAVILVVQRANKRTVASSVMLAVICFGAGSLSLQYADRDKTELITLTGCDTSILLARDQAVLLGTPDPHETTRLVRYLDYRGVRNISAAIVPDCPEQIGSGLLQLHALYGIDCAAGPDDLYILNELARALPETTVFSSGYTQILVLDQIRITAAFQDDVIKLEAGEVTVLKTAMNYTDMEQYGGGAIYLFREGYMMLPDEMTAQFEPVGRALFGETRILLDTDQDVIFA